MYIYWCVLFLEGTWASSGQWWPCHQRLSPRPGPAAPCPSEGVVGETSKDPEQEAESPAVSTKRGIIIWHTIWLTGQWSWPNVVYFITGYSQSWEKKNYKKHNQSSAFHIFRILWFHTVRVIIWPTHWLFYLTWTSQSHWTNQMHCLRVIAQVLMYRKSKCTWLPPICKIPKISKPTTNWW